LYNIFLKKSAEKDLDNISEPFLTQIVQGIEELKKGIQNVNIKKLINKKNEFRLRIGNYRILFFLEKDDKIIKISKILHRKDAYK
jgi:mRNA interferase RelE/StbE